MKVWSKSSELDSDQVEDFKNPSPRLEATRVLTDNSIIQNSLSSNSNQSTRNNDDKSILNKTKESAGDGTLAFEHYLHGTKLALCSISLLICMFLTALDQTIIAAMLTTVGSEFGEFEKISWITAGFMLSTSAFALSWGKISIIFGRKYTMLTAIFIFEIGSLICGLSNSMDMLIGGRVIAGIGGGGIQVLVFIIITEIVPLYRRSLFQGLVGAAFGVASVVGPLVGGAFTSNVSWRWCFYINLPIGGIAASLMFFLFNPPKTQGSICQKLHMIDYIGTFLLVSGLVLTLLALTFGSTNSPWDSAEVIICFVLGGVLLICFSIYNFRFSPNPLIPWEVIKVQGVITAVLSIFFVFGSFITMVIFLSIYMQVILKASPFNSGLQLLPLIIAVVLASIIGGATLTKVRWCKPYVIVGTTLGTVGTGLLLLLDQNSSLGERIGLLIIPGLGTGLLFQSLIISSQVAVPKSNGGVILATSLIAFGRALGASIGSSVGQTILNTSFRAEFKNMAQSSVILSSLDPSQLLDDPQILFSLPEGLQTLIIESFVHAFHSVTYLSLAFYSCGFICGLFTTNKRIPPPHVLTKASESA